MSALPCVALGLSRFFHPILYCSGLVLAGLAAPALLSVVLKLSRFLSRFCDLGLTLAGLAASVHDLAWFSD